jgi:hypothetical protein
LTLQHYYNCVVEKVPPIPPLPHCSTSPEAHPSAVQGAGLLWRFPPTISVPHSASLQL